MEDGTLMDAGTVMVWISIFYSSVSINITAALYVYALHSP